MWDHIGGTPYMDQWNNARWFLPFSRLNRSFGPPQPSRLFFAFLPHIIGGYICLTPLFTSFWAPFLISCQASKPIELGTPPPPIHIWIIQTFHANTIFFVMYAFRFIWQGHWTNNDSSQEMYILIPDSKHTAN